MRGYGGESDIKAKRMGGSIKDSFPEIDYAVAKPKPKPKPQESKPTIAATMPSPPFHPAGGNRLSAKPRRRRRFSNA